MSNTKPGDNIRFICSYLAQNPGSTYTQIRNALCLERGHDPVARRGQYTWYFRDTSKWIPMMGCGGPPRKNETRWEKRDGRYYLTAEGYAYLQA